jgi:hypothetical protein
MTVGDWIGLAGLVISVAGFSVVIWQSGRNVNAAEATGRVIERAEEPDWPMTRVAGATQPTGGLP